MRQKKQPEPDAGPLIVPVRFGTVSIPGDTVSVPITILRADMPLEEADKYLCERRLTGRITARPRGVAAAHQPLPGFEEVDGGDVTIEIVADAKRFGVTRREFSSALAMELASLDINLLARFSNHEGLLTIDVVADLAEPVPVARPRKEQAA